jgi:ATPase subunit of ABC transporter with duplicated ATPase domains
VILVSHDRWFVREVADRILEIRAEGLRDFRGGYDDYVAACGDDHLDVEAVSTRELRGRSAEVTSRAAPREAAARRPRAGDGAGSERARRRRATELATERDRLLEEVGRAEEHLKELHARFADPAFYAETGRAEVQALEEEERAASKRVQDLTEEWATVERELASLAAAAGSGA